MGPTSLTGQRTPHQAGNRIADTQSQEGLEPPTLVTRGLFSLRNGHSGTSELRARKPVPLQGSAGHLRGDRSPRLLLGNLSSPSPTPLPAPGLFLCLDPQQVKHHLLLSSLGAAPGTPSGTYP